MCYTLDGAKILKETWENNTLVPLYDNADEVCGIIYNGTPYFFIKNLQGDVIAITDDNGETVAKYSYDAWGVCSVEQDLNGIANINPYRYRSYYYDAETGMYYLQSRYYNPNVGRFVNGDEVELSSLGTILEKNLYAYCYNRPNIEIDKTGCVGASVLMQAVSSILELFMQIARTAGSMSKEMLNLKKKIERAKLNKASKEWINDLLKRKKNLMSNKSLGIGKLAIVTKVISFVATLLTYIPLLKKIKNGIKAVAEIVVEIFVEVIALIGSAIVSLVCKFIPTFGFLIGWALEFLIDYLIIPLVFDAARMLKMKRVYGNKMKNGGKFAIWIKAFGATLKTCF